MSELVEIIVSENSANLRLDVALTELLEIVPKPSRSQVAKWIDVGAVSVNSETVLKSSYLVEVNDVIQIQVPDAKPLEIVPDGSIKLDIVFEDSEILVINKQAGLVVHPGAGNWSGTLVNALAAYLGVDFFKDSLRPGIVHRLDKDTSGLMVIAKSQLALQSLSEQFLPPRKISREYRAVCCGNLSDTQGQINAAIARHPIDRKKMAISNVGKPAITNWFLEQQFSSGACLLRLKLETGRTHQIRVHLEHLKCPIIGDDIYGPAIGSLPNKIRKTCNDFSRQALHAYRLEFFHPLEKEYLSFQIDLPEDMKDLLEKLKNI